MPIATYTDLCDFLDRHFLSRMDHGGWDYDFIAYRISRFTNDDIDSEFARGYLRSMRVRGLCEYARGLMDEEGMLAGSGYHITPKGRERLGDLEAGAAPPEPQPGWQPIEMAPRDGTPVLVKVKDDLSPWGVSPTHLLCGLCAVMSIRGEIQDWGFAAPVGRGGFPDEWLDGWSPLPLLDLAAGREGGGE